jgi:hypothetical protein
MIFLLYLLRGCRFRGFGPWAPDGAIQVDSEIMTAESGGLGLVLVKEVRSGLNFFVASQ